MHALNARRVKSAAVLLAGALCGAPQGAAANDFEVTMISASFEQDHLLLHSELKLPFNEDLAEALEHGITLHVGLDIELQQVRAFVWDKTILSWEVRPELNYHSLSSRYFARFTPDGAIESFLTLGAALDYIERGPPLKLNLEDPLDFDAREYKLKVRARLANDRLPGPLRLWSYVAPSWRVSSGWSTWTLLP